MPIVGREAPKNKTHIQSVRFEKEHWTKERAEKWLKMHTLSDGNPFFIDGFDEAENEYRFRQYDPDYDNFTYSSITQNLPSGIYFIVGYPK